MSELTSIRGNSRPGREARPKTRSHPFKLPNRMKRGMTYRTPGGAFGVFVGTTPHGTHWFSYDGDAEYHRMCAAFDKVHPKPESGLKRGRPAKVA